VKLLFDTHAFIWWDSEPSKLSAKARAACEDAGNQLLFSVASAWEMQIKLQLRKLELKRGIGELIQDQRVRNGVEVLQVGLPHVLALKDLLAHHKDLFDRLLIAQANVESAFLVSHDPALNSYPVKLLW